MVCPVVTWSDVVVCPVVTWSDVVVCPVVTWSDVVRYKMLIHVRTHTNEKPHRCVMCGKSFSRLENLKIHNRSHTGKIQYQGV